LARLQPGTNVIDVWEVDAGYGWDESCAAGGDHDDVGCQAGDEVGVGTGRRSDVYFGLQLVGVPVEQAPELGTAVKLGGQPVLAAQYIS
jgi:hypothetical protein